MAVKILALLSLVFYFLALVFGLMLYKQADQRDILITSGEAYGYSTILKPDEVTEIQVLMQDEVALGESVSQLESELVERQRQLEALKQEHGALEKQLTEIEAKIGEFQKGEEMAIDFLRAKNVEEAVLVLDDMMTANEESLRFFVINAMPFMRSDTKFTKNYNKLLDAINTNRPLATAIRQIQIEASR